MKKEYMPLYMRIKSDIINKITAGELKKGDRLPAERVLAKTFRVSRVTIDGALSELEKEGIITKIQGSGFYVWTKEEFAINHAVNFLDSDTNIYGTANGEIAGFDKAYVRISTGAAIKYYWNDSSWVTDSDTWLEADKLDSTSWYYEVDPAILAEGVIPLVQRGAAVGRAMAHHGIGQGKVTH